MSIRKWNVSVFFLACFGLIGIGLIGCTGQKSDSEDNKKTAKSSTTRETKPVHVTVSDWVPTSVATSNKLESETSPAASPNKVIDESDARQVCSRFLELLQSGNRIAAENLLTKSALSVTGKAELVLQPLGGPDSRFEVSEPNYATIKNEVAYVDCEIIEGNGKNEERFSVTWLMKKQNSVWRISGLLANESPEGRLKLLSFENPNDVGEIKRRTSESTDSEASAR